MYVVAFLATMTILGVSNSIRRRLENCTDTRSYINEKRQREYGLATTT